MGSTKFKKRDLNRFRKIYPYIRRSPVWAYCADKAVTIEIGSITFTDANSGTHTFTETFDDIPTCTAVACDSEGNSSADVNVFIDSVTKTSLTISTSNNFTGKVEFHAILVGT